MKDFETWHHTVMHCLRTLLLHFLLSSFLSQAQPNPKLRFLDQLLRIIQKNQKVDTIYFLRHHAANNCLTDDWKPRDMPIVRSTEMTSFEIKRNYNCYRAMALVCINQDSDVRLLDNLAKSFNYMRQQRIILWMQVKVTKELLQEICRMTEKYIFSQMSVLETINPENATVKVLRLRPFPTPHFIPIDNVSTSNNIFHGVAFNFEGKEAIILPKKDNIFHYNISYGPKRTFTINTDEDRQIVEFSLRRNLSLKFYRGTNPRDSQFDMQLSPRLISLKDIAESANPFLVVSLIVVVPCGKERSIQDVFKQLNFNEWVLYILPVYATFVAVEWLMHLIIYRVTGHAHRLSFLNPLVNLRAFAAILGLPFPVCRRWSFSLHQLFLVLSIFGFVFSNFFACKLSALLTKHSRYAQVQNFEQLRDSGLLVVIDKGVRDYLMREVDANFLATIVPNTVTFDIWQRARIMLSLNDSYGYIVFKDFFPLLDRYQKALGQKVLCDAPNLTLISNLPKMFYLSKNSIYKWPLRKFVHRIYESGMNLHWKKDRIDLGRKALNVNVKSVVKQEAVPLSFEHFNWLWFLLIFGYGLAILVFLIELLMGSVKKWQRKQRVRVRFTEA